MGIAFLSLPESNSASYHTCNNSKHCNFEVDYLKLLIHAVQLEESGSQGVE